MILVGHNITELRKLPEKSVHCVVTSPPYFGLRAYGTDPQIWGGLEECDHDWADATVKNSRHIDTTAGNKQRSNPGSVDHRTERPGGSCSKCGAWLGELGSEPTPEMFVANLVEVFAEVWRVLRDDGVCWMNLGDSYAGSGKGGNPPESPHQKQRTNSGSLSVIGQTAREAARTMTAGMDRLCGLKPKDLVGIPWRAAFALQAAGWYLRQDIIWQKPNPMPESVQDRCTKAHEYIFLLTKSERYFFDAEAIKTVSKDGGREIKYDGQQKNLTADAEIMRTRVKRNVIVPEAANRRSVWSVSTFSYKGAHFATFPPRLVEPCILAGTSAAGCCPHCGKPWARVVESQRIPTRPGTGSKVYVDPENSPYEKHNGDIVGNRDPQRHIAVKVTTGWKQSCQCEPHEAVPCTVLDPFGGSGTTAIVAAYHGRSWLLCELNEKYAELARARIAEGWTPPKPKSGKKRRKKTKEQRELFTEC